jgi:heme/copper-type cytochrome/quinol oxidase subunit 1
MITDTDLLQANATLITGVLIFLTIAPFSRSAAEQIIERKAVLGTVLAILVTLAGSVSIVLLSTSDFDYDLAKIFFVIGLFLIVVAVFLILLALPEKAKEQEGQNERPKRGG